MVMALVSLSGLVLGLGHSANTYADPVTLRATVEPVLRVTLDSDLVSLDLSPINSTTAFDNEDLNVTVVTNNQAGYNLSLTASSTDLTRTTALADNTTPTIPTLTTAASADNFPVNRWGYRTDSTANYSPFATTINFPSVTTPTDGTNTTINFAAKINDAQPAGTYELDLVFAATARPTTQDFIINFDSGVSSVAVKTGSTTGTTVGSVATTGGTVAGLANGATYYLVPTFAEGYEFSSWTNDSGSVGTLGTADANGIVTYTVGDQVDAGDINSVTLATEDVRPAMQNLADDMCVTSEPTLVKDTRDGKTYTVQRLADGKCWMTSNLNLAGGTKLDSEGSNVPAGYTQSNPYYTLPGSVSGTNSSDFLDDSTAYVSNKTNTTCGSDAPCYSYYSWLAATAGGKDASGNAVTSNGYNTAYSICPKGWRLPTATTSNAYAQSSNNWKTGDFYALATAYGANLESSYIDNSSATGGNFYNNVNGGNAAGKAPVYLLLAGLYYSGSFDSGGSSGRYWSATSYSSARGYYLYFASGYVGSANDGNRKLGLSVRCVKQTDAEILQSVGTMQNVTSELVSSIADGTTATLTDSRDNQSYTVAKINGNLWMTRNLAIGCNGTGSTYGSSISSKALTSANSNVSSDWSTPTALLSTSANSSSSSGYTTAAMQCNATYGGYYNYKAATAGTISGSSNIGAQTYDICPKGWRLPTQSEFNGITGSPSAFSPVYSGSYNNGSLSSTGSSGYGYWWSSTPLSNTHRYSLYYRSGSLNGDYYHRYRGYSVRCVLAEQ